MRDKNIEREKKGEGKIDFRVCFYINFSDFF
jgi:hypothetical protein